jgi:hypothetical protein
MAQMEDKFQFTAHSLERGLERLFKYEPPYSGEDMFKMKQFILNNMIWHIYKEKWVLEDFDAELVINDGSVVTLIIKNPFVINDKKISEYQKRYSKKCMRLGKVRNQKSKGN